MFQRPGDIELAEELHAAVTTLKQEKATLIEQRNKFKARSPEAQELTQQIAEVTYEIRQRVDYLMMLNNTGRVKYQIH